MQKSLKTFISTETCIGKSKYGLKRIPKGFFDLLTVLFLTKYKKRPMHFFAGIGSLFAGTGIAVLLTGCVLKFFKTALPFQFPWLVGGFGILTGILLSAIGLLGELIIALRNE